MTNTTFFNQTELPARFGVIGSGVIGLELAQCMQRFGSQVTVFGRSGKILEKEDEDASALVKEQVGCSPQVPFLQMLVEGRRIHLLGLKGS